MATFKQLFMLLLVSAALISCSSSLSSPTRLTAKHLPTYKSSVFVVGSPAGTFMPSVGNGYLGSVVFSDRVHISGVYSGRAHSKKAPIYPVHLKQHTHRARIPSTAAIEFSTSLEGNRSYALDVADGVFYAWFEARQLSVEQRVYAHRSRKHILVVEITATNSDSRSHVLFLKLNSGGYSKDIRFWEYPLNGTVANYAIGKVRRFCCSY